MAYEMLTRTGRNFYEVTSVMQNSIRKGDYEIAGHCLWELLPGYSAYLRKRFLVISAEDCYGVITKEILNLVSQPGDASLERALSVLCKSKKNRDADYFVCNLMDQGNMTDAKKEDLARQLVQSISDEDVVLAGRLSYQMFKKGRKYLWEVLKDYARVYHPHLESEFEALCEANERVSKPAEETIFVAKAIVLLWTKKDSLGYAGMRYDDVLKTYQVTIIKPCDQCQKVNGLFPDWAYNWHTYRGKYTLKRDAIHAITNDQQILNPLEENLFDDCTWNKDINACLMKWNPRKVQLPYDDGKIDPAVKYPGKAKAPEEPEPEQMTLFDL